MKQKYWAKTLKNMYEEKFMNITKSISLVLGLIFKDNEDLMTYVSVQYYVTYIYKYTGGIIQVSWLVLWEKYVWLLNMVWRLTENRPVLEVHVGFKPTLFGNDQNDTTLVSIHDF